MNDLRHLKDSAFVESEDINLSIMIPLLDGDDGLPGTIGIFHRAAGDPDLEYQAHIRPGSRAELIFYLNEAIAILERLPDNGTIEEICAAMGTTADALHV